MFSHFFIERPRFAIVLSVILVLTGIVSMTQLPVAEYPEIAPPQLYVSATYTGASADVLMQTVAIPIEDQINGVDDLLYFSSTCNNEGQYSCAVTFKSGTDSDIALVNLTNAVKRAEPKLPSEVTKIGLEVQKRGEDMLAMFVFMTDGTKVSVQELDNYINNNIKDAVSRLDGVSSSEVLSRDQYSMRAWLDTQRMAGLNLTVTDVMSAIESQNLQAAAGQIGTERSNPYLTFKLNVQGRLKTAEEFGEIVLRRDSDGSMITLKDVAKVEVGKISYSGRAIFNGKQVIPLVIYRTSDANALSTVERVKDELKSWEKYLPEGVTYDVGYDPTEFIDVSMKEIYVTIILALLLVVLITWLFLQDWRATLVPSIAIPIALLGTFPFMLAMNYSINVLTMFGLILVIGSLCDDAIVVVENCQALMQREGLSAKEAARKTMTQITGAILATTLVTIACYVPLAFYGGMVGNIYIQFAVTMCISLCLSTFVAMTLSPVICAYMLRKPAEHPSKLFAPFNWMLNGSRYAYLAFVKLLVRRGFITLVLFAAMLFGAYELFKHTRSSFLPKEDKCVVLCSIELPTGASQARTNAAVDKFIQRLDGMPGIRSTVVISGFSMITASGENVATGIIMLDHWDKRKTPELQLDAMTKEIQKRTADITEARISCFTPPAINGLGITGGATFELCALGETTPAQLSDTAKKLCLELSNNPKFMYAISAFNADTPQIFLDIDRKKAESLGLSAGQIFRTLQGNFASIYVNDFTLSSINYRVQIQASPEERSSLKNIRNIQIQNTAGEMVPLTSVATLKYTVDANQIMRFNKKICAEINVAGAPGVSSNEVMRLIDEYNFPDGYKVEWTGISYQEKQNEGQIWFLMALALVFAYLFLVAQYESWSIPIPVMLTVGTAITGSLLGIWFCGTKLGLGMGFQESSTLSIYAQLGMVMLIGLTAKNAILMVEFSKQEREAGKSVFDAAVNGANMRYRAVLMTAWSFIFGVFPMVVATGAGAGSRQSIGVTTFAGMLLATIVGIIFTPALYAICQRWRERVKKLLKMGQKN